MPPSRLSTLLLALLLLTVAAPAFSAEMVSPEQQARISRLEHEIMASCCWNGTIADHKSATVDQQKADLRRLVVAGKSDREVLDWFVEQHGTQILAAPPFIGASFLVWLLPVVGFLLGGLIYLYRIAALREETMLREKQNLGGPESGDNDPYLRQLQRELEEFDQA